MDLSRTAVGQIDIDDGVGAEIGDAMDAGGAAGLGGSNTQCFRAHREGCGTIGDRQREASSRRE